MTDKDELKVTVDVHDWWGETGTYGICIGASSFDIRLSQNIKVIGNGVLKRKYTLDTTIGGIPKETLLELLEKLNA